MKLVIKNLGSLQHAEIDLSKRFYLFTGYNNTGKTYVSKLLYQIFQRENIEAFANSPYNPLENINEVQLEESFVKNFLLSFGKYLAEAVIPKILKVGKEHFIVRNLQIEFSYNQDEIEPRSLESSTNLGVRSKKDDTDRNIELFTLVKPKNSLLAKFNIVQNEDIFKELPDDFFEEGGKEAFEKELNKMKADLPKNLLASSFLNLLLQNKEEGFFLPANRIFLLENANDMLGQEQKRKKEMVEGLLEVIESKNTDKETLARFLRMRAESNYTFDIDTLLGKIADLRNEKNTDFVERGSEFHTTYLNKMKNIMGGEIMMIKPSPVSNWVERFKVEGEGLENEEPIHLYLASSSVNQLALLFQFFKYWAKPERNFLMIDEPEINLHPEKQIQIINMLLPFVTGDKNNRLLLTSHSPLITEMISNYLNLSFLKKQGVAINQELIDMPYFDTNINLEEEEVGIYAFHKDSVEEYKRERYGVLYKNINKELNKLSNIRSLLTDEIYENV